MITNRTRVKALAHPVRLVVVWKYFAQLLLVVAALTTVPLLVSALLGDLQIASRYIAVIAVFLIIAAPAARRPAPSRIQANEAMLITVLAFTVSPVLMTYPLTAAGLPFEDALFEAISAVTTTGLTTATELQNRTPGYLFARAWMQWYGGLGIVVLSIALLMGHRLAARQLADPLSADNLATTAGAHARRMLAVYFVLTLAGLVVLWALVGDGWTALLHTLTAVSTGGFAPHDSSVAAITAWPARYSIIAIAFCGALPLPLYYFAWARGAGTLFRDPEFRGLVILVALVSLLLSLSMFTHSGYDLLDCLANGIFMGVSAQTGTGFSTLDVESLDDGSKIVLIISMLVGGGMGSTAGGIKVIRLLILLRLLHLLIIRTALPAQAVTRPSLGGKPLEDDDILRALLVIVLFNVVVVISWLIFVLHGYPALDALFEVASATGTVGLSTGITDHSLSLPLKLLLCLDMLLGRVEIVAVLVILYPRTWIGKRTAVA